jgi:hypothetical protein
MLCQPTQHRDILRLILLLMHCRQAI